MNIQVDIGGYAVLIYVLAYFVLNWWEHYSPSKTNLKTGKKLPGKNVWNGINSLFDSYYFFVIFSIIIN